MSVLLYFLFGAITFFGILILVGLFLPQNVHVEKSAVILAEPDDLFEEVADFEKFVTWNPWTKKDPNIKQWFEGEKISVGSKYSWEGNKKVGKGNMQITHIEANRRVEMDLNFGPQGMAKCGFIIEPQSGNTKVTWYFDSDMGRNPMKRIFGKMMDKFIANDYSQGLANLSRKFENK